MVNIDQREIASYNATHAARAGVDRPTALSWLWLFRRWMGLQPIRVRPPGRILAFAIYRGRNEPQFIAKVQLDQNRLQFFFVFRRRN